MSKKKKKYKRTHAQGRSNDPFRAIQPYAGWIALAGVVVVAAVAGVLIIGSGGSSGEDTPDQITASPVDPRVGAATPAASLPLSADDEGQEVNPRFEPNSLSGPAGQVVEIVMTNNGTVVHNVRVSGSDRAYDTPDDFFTTGVKAGEQESLRLKIPQPGSYPFRCDFHPQNQIGTLVLR
jgi:plastocyanin